MAWDLSDEQTHAIGRDRAVAYSLAQLPVGRQPTPAWARDLHVDFMDGYGNVPRFIIKTDCEARDWADKRFEFDGRRYIAKSGDGRAECYYHGEARRVDGLKRWRCPDGTIRHGPRWLEGGRIEAGEWETYEGWATGPDQGFGGSHFHLTMIDGREVVLRGPWHGGCPPGYVEASYFNTSDRWGRAFRKRKPQPWWNRGGRAGLFIEAEVFKLLFARFTPHLQLFEVAEGDRVWLQAAKPEWDCPKDVWIQRARDAHLRRTLAALAAADEPVKEVLDRDHDFAVWALISLSHSKLAERVSYTDKTYRITEAGRAALSAAEGRTNV